ncbi:restriction endonuclease [Floricoccus tropicus]|nr:restriction endonuclease [Floricoccus tropicus]
MSRLFSESESPYLYYRVHENIFTKYFDVNNNARSDDSVDAYNSTSGIGIGLKTWVGNDDQKVAEFGRLRSSYDNLVGIDLITKIAELRNIRIRTTKNAHGLHNMFYHIIKRIPKSMCIYETTFDEIDIPNIELIEDKGNDNNTYFNDGKHTYHFSRSKNTLFMIFNDMELLERFDVEIYEDPYEIISELSTRGIKSYSQIEVTNNNQLCLKLYSTKNDIKFVPEKSGLNQWNANGRPRDLNEIYIPYPAEDRRRGEFFPSRDTPFELELPDGQLISAKVCQQDSKAIMSNPNRLLGNWLLRTVFELKEGTIVTYDMLREFNIDSMIFTKLTDSKYKVEISELGTYENFYGLKDVEDIV